MRSFVVTSIALRFYRMTLRVLHPLLILSLALLAGCSERSSEPEKAPAAEKEAAVEWAKPTDAEAASYIKECQRDYEQVVAQLADFADSKKTYDTAALLSAINGMDMLIDHQMNLASLYANVHPNAELRTTAEACEQQFVTLISELSLSRPFYERVAAIDLTQIDDLDKRFVNHMLKDFRRSGVDKDDATRQQIKQLNEEINLIAQTFDKNIRDGAKKLVLNSVDDLKGLSQDYIDSHKPNEDGKIIITTAYPDYFPFMQYADNDELRKQLYVIFRQQAYPENRDVLHKLLTKRYQLAKLLGFKNFAELITDDKMIKNPDNAQAFIDKVSAIASPRAQAEYSTLLKRLQKINPDATKVDDWQKMYLEELVKKEQYQVDSQKVRQYFQFNNVRQGIFDLTQAMFGVTIKSWNTEVWHPSVTAYEIWDGDQVIGRFYLDMHPRDGKYNHAAEFPIINGIKDQQLPVVALVCNFPGGDGSLGLMEHSDVETFLHEFGHLIHNIFAGSNQRWMYFSGIKTEWDFVEAPSQMLEEWVWDAETLATFAKNDKGEVIPPALVEKMIAGRDFGKAMWTKHQLFYAALSLGFYNQDPATLDLDKAMETIQATYSPFGYVDDTYFYASFGHLNGYSAIYYTYMWSLVIAADMHSEFAKKGLRNAELSHHYRKTVLEPGGAKDATDLVSDFLGRPYSFDAFANDLSVK